jgi:urea transport system substrate-binding protein
VPFYKELGNQGLKAEDIPVVAFSVGEEELRGIDTKPLVGHLAAWNYFMSVDSPINSGFIDKWKAYVKKNNLPDGDKRVTNDPMEATYVGIMMWKQAVIQSGSFDVDAVRQAVAGQVYKAPSGFEIKMDERNHHLHKPVLIGEVQADGQFKIVWKTDAPVRAMPWSPFVPDSAKKVADWTFPWVCGNCTQAKYGSLAMK